MSRENEALYKINYERIKLEHIISTLNLLSEALENEVQPHDKQKQDATAILFVQRVEMFQKVLYHALWDLETVAENIEVEVNSVGV